MINNRAGGQVCLKQARAALLDCLLCDHRCPAPS
jgi:hypothetical protein